MSSADAIRVEYTLVADGPSDRCLVGIITWTLQKALEGRDLDLIPRFADFRYLRQPPRKLEDRLRLAYSEYGGDLLFVHRDAERQTRESRVREIARAARAADIPRFVPVVPVRMTQAWLLIDEAAIRRAADSPSSFAGLEIPALNALEMLADPKALLTDLLVHASQKRGRHLLRFRRDLATRIQRVAQIIDDFSLLRTLPAFQAFEADARAAIAQLAG
ncbi:MAG: DUF4276 family protein [Planctomycetales bacterium]|nr:DUF4276 family protein [Planctomycetales bacterium]